MFFLPAVFPGPCSPDCVSFWEKGGIFKQIHKYILKVYCLIRCTWLTVRVGIQQGEPEAHRGKGGGGCISCPACWWGWGPSRLEACIIQLQKLKLTPCAVVNINNISFFWKKSLNGFVRHIDKGAEVVFQDCKVSGNGSQNNFVKYYSYFLWLYFF